MLFIASSNTSIAGLSVLAATLSNAPYTIFCATPIFDGAKLDDLSEWTDKAGLPRFCSTYLYDGETGEQFDQPATVGMTYFLKLGHMVEDKMHARSIGPYSLITQLL